MEKFKTEDVIQILLQQWKKLALITFVAALVGYGVTFFIKPLYKSYAVVYPVNMSPSSEESSTEQLLQWFNSEEVKQAVAAKFDLYNHYDINPTGEKHDTYFNLRYKELVSVNSTLYESIEISVKDTDPKLAKEIVNGIIEATNDLIMSVRKERLKEYIDNNEKEMAISGRKIDSLKYMINSIRKEYNIIDFQYQSKYISKELTKSPNLSESNAKIAEGLKIQRTELERLRDVINAQINTYNGFRNEVDKHHLDYANKISFTNVVSKPTLPDSKCYPIRSLMAIIISMSTLLVACIVILFLNLKKK
jgi:LPS O-antigen subunit length determinant protein (WzzB/FepE family)